MTRKEDHLLTSNLDGTAPRSDPYFWLRSDTRDKVEVLALLEEENAYAAAVMEPSKPLQDLIFNEMLDR